MIKYSEKTLEDILSKYTKDTVAYTESDRVRVLENKTLLPILDGLKKQYNDYTASKIVSLPFTAFKRFYYDGNRKDGEYWYYYNRKRLRTVALMAWLYGEKEYISELEDSLWAIMDEYVWNIPAHVGNTALTELQQDSYIIDLFSAETCFVIAEILDLVGDKLEPIISKRARRMIDERCFDVLDKPFHWKTTTNNWSGVCAGQIGMTAIRMKEDPSELAKIIKTCLDTLEYYISGFPADGTCREGLGYWGYGFSNFTYFAEMLYRRTSGEINLFDDEKIKRIAGFPRKCFFKHGKIVTFSDCGGSDSSKFMMPLTMKLHDIYPDIPLPPKALFNYDFSTPSLRMLLWAPDESYEGTELKPETFVLPDAQWYISSTDSGMGIAAKAGYNFEAHESHNHNDIGSFHIYKNQANLISDLGAGVYNGTYFAHETRYRVFCCCSRGHSVPIIDGEYQKYGEKYHANNVLIDEQTGLTADIAAAYGVDNLKSLMRNVRLDKEKNRVYVTDTYKFESAPSSVTERFVSYNEPKIAEDGTVEISAKGETLRISFDREVLKPVIRVYEDVDHLVRHRDGFKAYMVDLEVKNPDTTFKIEVVME